MMRLIYKGFLFMTLIISTPACTAGEFKLISWNILANRLYEKYVFWQNFKKNDSANIVQLINDKKLMPFEQRLKLFKHVFEQDGFGHDSDIICLQEFDLKEHREGIKIIQFLQQSGYEVITPTTTGSHGTCIAYNTHKFVNLATESWTITRSTGNDTKHLVSLMIAHKNNNHFLPIQIINCYMPWETVENENLHLKSIKDNILSHINKDCYTIICGDFNYETWNTRNENLKSYSKLTDSNHFDSKFWHDAGKEHGFAQTSTNYFNVFQKVDYTFYTPLPINKPETQQLVCTAYRQEPNDYKKLIKHMEPQKNDGPIFDDFPSDHCAMVATFAFKNRERSLSPSK